MHQRFPLLAAGVLGATGVALGALGSHALGGYLADRGTRAVWETAVQYHLFHAAALIGIAGWMRVPPTGVAARRAILAIRSWVAGTILFSGSLYLLAAGAPSVVGWLTPVGGVILIVGWGFAAGAAVAPRSEYDV
jgi:uncharacterized membrane protein YgdD (TMEM256/DUF423 family)